MPNTKFLSITFLAMLSFVTTVFTQNPEWINYNATNSGLPDNYILSIAMDGNGNKWIGTDGTGIVRFDGLNWTTYDSSNSGLPDNDVRSIVIDGGGVKWIGTYDGGLCKFDGVNWTTFNTSNSGLPYNDVRSIAIDSGGNKWIATYGGGICRFDGLNWTTYNTSNSGLSENIVRSIAIDGSGIKWIGTWGGGLSRFDGLNWATFNSFNSDLPVNSIWSIAIDTSGNKWIGTYGGGLVRFDGLNWTIYNTSNSDLSDNYVRSITIDESGNKWIGTDNLGLTKFDGINWTNFNTSNSSLPENVVFSIVIDTSGNKWIGTYGGGLAIYNEGGIRLPLTVQTQVRNITCNGMSDGFVNIMASFGNPPYQYKWSFAQSTDSSHSSGLSAGSYFVTVLDSKGESNIQSFTIIQPKSIKVTISIKNPHGTGATDGIAFVSVTDGVSPYTYIWNDGLAQTTPTAFGLSEGIYNVTITDSNGCSIINEVVLKDSIGTFYSDNLKGLENSFSAHFDPVGDVILLEGNFSIENKNLTIKLYDDIGRLVSSYSLNQIIHEKDFEFQIPTKNNKNGIYFIRLFFDSNEMAGVKTSIQK